ncbi:MAG: hypothetical protein ABFS32_02355 [Bacteroidota bacterium]
MAKTPKNIQKTCQECGNPIQGRLDKKFCDAYCRNAFNNRVKRDDEQLIIAVNRQIRKNRRILKTLCPQGKAVVRKELLDKLGYQYGVFSGIYKYGTATYFLCYDYGFAVHYERSIPKAVIIQQQDYMSDYNPWKT